MKLLDELHLSPVSRHIQSACRMPSRARSAASEVSGDCRIGLQSSMKMSHSSYCHQEYTAWREATRWQSHLLGVVMVHHRLAKLKARVAKRECSHKDGKSPGKY
jgi:hypothetical protein